LLAPIANPTTSALLKLISLLPPLLTLSAL
jgi:hypothetical protein